MSAEWWALDALVEEYKQHQRRTRGLRERTLDGYERLVRLFVRAVLGEDPVDPSRLNSGDVGRVRRGDARAVLAVLDEGRAHRVALVLSLPAVRGSL
jgi:hypothetical protein